MDSDKKQELYALAAARRQAQREARSLDRRIGELARRMVDDDQDRFTQSSIANILGVSHTTVGTYIAAAARAEAEAVQERIPRMYTEEAVEYVQAQRAKLQRVVGGFSEQDVLDATGLDPRLLQNGYWSGIPNMLWQLDTGEWIGIQDVNIGYGGTGPSNAIRGLRGLGFDDDTAYGIAEPRFVDAQDITKPSTWITSTTWPYHPRPVPQVIHGHIVYNWHAPSSREVPSPSTDPSGFYATTPAVDGITAWLNFLDKPEPWAAGTRAARVFLTGEAAAEQGFLEWHYDYGIRSYMTPQLVIEQGDVQLWCHMPSLTQTERRNGRILPDAAHDLLIRAGLFSDALDDLERREASLLARIARTALGRGSHLPPYLDIPSPEQASISFQPATAE